MVRRKGTDFRHNHRRTIYVGHFIAVKLYNRDKVMVVVVDHPGNGVGTDRTHEQICGRIACASGGKITYQRFDEPLSMLGFVAASDVFGASLYEPCGQIDQVGNLFGATATNRDTGGYHDKIRELIFSDRGETGDIGNGFLFRDYDCDGLWYGLTRTVQFHRLSPEIRERQIKRILRETRQAYDPEKMVDRYIEAYETLSGGVPLRVVERTRELTLDLDDHLRGKWLQFAFSGSTIGHA